MNASRFRIFGLGSSAAGVCCTAGARAALALDARSDAYELMLVRRLVALHGGVALHGRRHARLPFRGPEAAVGVRMIVRGEPVRVVPSETPNVKYVL